MKAPAALLCLALASSAQAVDPDRFTPFGETPFGPYRPQICDKFLQHERISYLEPVLQGEKLERLFVRCPALLGMHERVRVQPSGTALYEVDIDNDGRIDHVLYVQNLFRHLESETFFKLDLANCKMTRIFGAARANRLFTLGGRAYIESLQRCQGPIKILGGLRYLNCTLIYESKGTELQPYRDELCVYIDRAWSRR
jgi:hypothetical protein